MRNKSAYLLTDSRRIYVYSLLHIYHRHLGPLFLISFIHAICTVRVDYRESVRITFSRLHFEGRLLLIEMSSDEEELSVIIDPEERIQELCLVANQVDVDFSKPLSRYYKKGNELLNKGDDCFQAGEFEEAFIFFMRFLNVFVDKLKAHPDYDKKEINDYLVNNAKNVMAKTERLKDILTVHFEKEWRLLEMERRTELWEEEMELKRLEFEQEMKRKQNEEAERRRNFFRQFEEELIQRREEEETERRRQREQELEEAQRRRDELGLWRLLLEDDGDNAGLASDDPGLSSSEEEEEDEENSKEGKEKSEKTEGNDEGDGIVKSNECRICLNVLKSQVAFVPCFHTQVCKSCAKKTFQRTRKCPMCRRHIDKIQKLF